MQLVRRTGIRRHLSYMDRSRRKQLLMELAVVFAAFFLPSTAAGLIGFLAPPSPSADARWVSELYHIIAGIATLAPVLYIAWKSGDPMSGFGLKPAKWWKGALAVIALVAYQIVAYPLYAKLWKGWFGWSSWSTGTDYWISARPLTSADWAVLVYGFALFAFVEEFICRGYLLARLTELTGRFWIACVAASALFASYHIYEGVYMLPWAFGFGIAMSLAYRITGSIWPSTIAHFLINVLTMIGYDRLQRGR